MRLTTYPRPPFIKLNPQLVPSPTLFFHPFNPKSQHSPSTPGHSQYYPPSSNSRCLSMFSYPGCLVLRAPHFSTRSAVGWWGTRPVLGTCSAGSQDPENVLQGFGALHYAGIDGWIVCGENLASMEQGRYGKAFFWHRGGIGVGDEMNHGNGCSGARVLEVWVGALHRVQLWAELSYSPEETRQIGPGLSCSLPFSYASQPSAAAVL